MSGGEVKTKWVAAKELLNENYSNFPADALGALSLYIQRSEAFFEKPSEEKLQACDDAIRALEVFCARDTRVRDAHTRIEGILNFEVVAKT